MDKKLLNSLEPPLPNPSRFPELDDATLVDRSRRVIEGGQARRARRLDDEGTLEGGLSGARLPGYLRHPGGLGRQALS